jgi:hypothetical protein
MKNKINEIPRRNRLDMNNSAEKLIYEAMCEVEELGADKKLTEAVMLLAKAKNCVADYVDKVDKPKPEETGAEFYCPECGRSVYSCRC